jgi:hypothetical protein
LLQPRDQPGVDEGGLARAGLGVEEQQPLGDDAGQQVARLLLASEEEAPLGEKVLARRRLSPEVTKAGSVEAILYALFRNECGVVALPACVPSSASRPLAAGRAVGAHRRTRP